MDIIDRIIDNFIDHFSLPLTNEEKESFLRAQRQTEGGQKHYVYSSAASDHTARCRAVFAGMRAGLTTAQIAERVGLAQRTVQNIIARKPLA